MIKPRKWTVNMAAEIEDYCKRVDEGLEQIRQWEEESPREDLKHLTEEEYENYKLAVVIKSIRQDDEMEEYINDLEYEDGDYVHLGDEVERIGGGWGIALGRICEAKGKPVCYKVWAIRDGKNKKDGYIDYYPANEIFSRDMCGDPVWSLGRIGFEPMEEENTGFLCMYNKELDEVAIW